MFDYLFYAINLYYLKRKDISNSNLWFPSICFFSTLILINILSVLGFILTFIVPTAPSTEQYERYKILVFVLSAMFFVAIMLFYNKKKLEKLKMKYLNSSKEKMRKKLRLYVWFSGITIVLIGLIRELKFG